MNIARTLLIIGISAAIGAFLGHYINERDVKNLQILYVSEDELMELEKQRVEADNIDTRQLFFGRIDKAVHLATTIPKSYEGSTTRVIYSTSSVTGKNVRSISKEVHMKIIEELADNKK